MRDPRKKISEIRWVLIASVSVFLCIQSIGCGHGYFHNVSTPTWWPLAPPPSPGPGNVPPMPSTVSTRPGPRLLTNPAQIPDQDSEFVWAQIIDTLDDYFQIDSEQRVLKNGQQWMDGKVITYPEVGATYLEPWRKDAIRGFQRLQSSLQTIRRTAIVDVTPTTGGYSISVVVNKDLEEVDRSQNASDGSAAVRHDGSVVRTDPTLIGQPITLSWIPQERDNELEQRILQEIVGRCTDVERPRKRLLHHD